MKINTLWLVEHYLEDLSKTHAVIRLWNEFGVLYGLRVDDRVHFIQIEDEGIYYGYSETIEFDLPCVETVENFEALINKLKDIVSPELTISRTLPKVPIDFTKAQKAFKDKIRHARENPFG